MFVNVIQHMYLFPNLISVLALIQNHTSIKLQVLVFHAQILQIQPIRQILLLETAFVILTIHGTQLKVKLLAFAQITPLLWIMTHAFYVQD